MADPNCVLSRTARVKKTPSTKPSKIVLRKETITILRAVELAAVAGAGLPVCPRPIEFSYVRDDCF